MAITGQIGVRVSLTDERTGDMESGVHKTVFDWFWTVAGGTGANQADLLWSDERTLATGANEDIDVASNLAGLYGTAIFAKVKAIGIYALTTNTTLITVSRPATSGLPFLAADADALAPLPAGGMFFLSIPSAAGIAVSAGADDVINIANSAGASGTYRILILGISA